MKVLQAITAFIVATLVVGVGVIMAILGFGFFLGFMRL